MTLPRIPSYSLPTADDLPSVRGPWRPEPGRAALLIHDMQAYFCAAFAPDASPLPTVLSNIARLAGAARAAGIPVIYTAQQGDQFRPDRGLQADLWGPGMQDRPDHVDIMTALTPKPGDITLVKHRYSAFQRSTLAEILRARGRDQILITGIYAHIGCMMTAAEAFQQDIEPFAVVDAQADFDRARHDMAMSWVGSCCGGLCLTDPVLELLEP